MVAALSASVLANLISVGSTFPENSFVVHLLLGSFELPLNFKAEIKFMRL